MFRSRLRGSSSLGFTLLELLVVVTILGILAGVVIAVISPTHQRDRARDAANLATLNKLLLVAQGHVSARGSAPTEQRLADLVDKFVPMDAADCTIATLSVNQSCRFSIEGVELPNNCGTEYWTGSATSSGQCHFFYYRSSGWDSERFRLFAKSWGLAGRTFVVDTADAGVYHCDGTSIGANRTVDLSGAAFCEEWTD